MSRQDYNGDIKAPKKNKFLRKLITAGALVYAGSIGTTYVSHLINYREADAISKDTNNSAELRSASRAFADSEGAALKDLSTILNPLSDRMEKPYVTSHTLK